MSEVEELRLRVAQLEKENAGLKRINLEQQKKLLELERRLNAYENAHTPPSLSRYPQRKKGEGSGRIGRPPGYEGSTRPTPEPEETIEVTMDDCPSCKKPLGKPIRFESRIIEEIPEPQPIKVTEYKLAHYECKNCGSHIVARHPDCPREGRLGVNALTHVTMLKYSGRVPHRRIAEMLESQFGLRVTPATILDVTRRATDALRKEYDKLLSRVRESPWVHVDETSIKVNGVQWWAWVFVTGADTLVVVRHSRAKKVLNEILGWNYRGIVISDGYRIYSNFTENRQRCWAHFLREAEKLAENFREAVPFHKALLKLYHKLMGALETKPPPEEKEQLFRNACNSLRYWLQKEWKEKKVVNLVENLGADLKKFLTFVVVEGVAPTNNAAERALREHVVIRKIIGTLRNEKGARIHETALSLIATWKQRGLNPYVQLSAALRS